MTLASRVIRNWLIRLLASILTIAISILYVIFRFLIFLPIPHGSYLIHDIRYSLSSCCNKIRLQNILYIILNSTLSLISALMIANYCENMLGLVQWVSHQVHVVFLSFVFPKFPQLTTYTPSKIVVVYLMVGYLGLTAQLSLTLDLIYIYNLPAIYIYKILALSYSKLLNAIKFCKEVIDYDHTKWLTCQYPILLKTHNINKLIGYGAILVLIQILLIVGFYYIWLALVIIVLMCLMNAMRNLIEIGRSLSSFLLALKGYNIEIGKFQQNEQNDNNIRNILVMLSKIKINWIPLIKLHDIRNVFLGKDIIKAISPQIIFDRPHFRPGEIYRCMINSGHN